MTGTVVAYVPVLHEGYRRFLAAHATGGRCFVPDRALYADYRPLAKDIRALDPELVVAGIRGWGICATVEVLDADGAEALAAEGGEIVLPDEDVSFQLVDRFFRRSPVRYDTTFLRWDRRRTVQLLQPRAARTVDVAGLDRDMFAAAERRAGESRDWWRQVGAALRFPDGEIIAACNVHAPHRDSPYAVGDPRSNFFRGVHLELTTAEHAEAHLIAAAARAGRATDGATMYVTDFPCPPCARLIAGAGISRLYFGTGYAVLDGEDVLRDAGVEVVQVVPE